MDGTKYKHFYGNQSEQFTFYKVPKQLFVDGEFHNVSAEAKLLYGILLDRMSLSSANGWFDEDEGAESSSWQGNNRHLQHIRYQRKQSIFWDELSKAR